MERHCHYSIKLMAKVESWIQTTYIFLSKNQMYDKDEIMGLEQSDWVVGKY